MGQRSTDGIVVHCDETMRHCDGTMACCLGTVVHCDRQWDTVLVSGVL